jgi:carbonic anhydrase
MDEETMNANQAGPGPQGRFCTVINCMDGRVQLPVIRFLQQHFNVEHVDSVTEPGPCLILSEQKNPELLQSIVNRVEISLKNHGSVGIAVVGHHDCAGNPAPKEDQLNHIRSALRFFLRQWEGVETVGLWVDSRWEVHEVPMED